MLPVMNSTPVTTSSAAHHLLDRAEMGAEAAHEAEERPGEQAGDDEGNAEAEPNRRRAAARRG